jgi:hypothetical protein
VISDRDLVERCVLHGVVCLCVYVFVCAWKCVMPVSTGVCVCVCVHRPVMAGLRLRTQRVPGLGYLTEYAADVLDTLTSYYTYTSCSS